MTADDPFYKFQAPPDLTEDGIHFQYRSPENDWASDKAQAARSSATAGHPFRGYFETVASVEVLRIQNGDINSVPPPEVQGGSAPEDYSTDDFVYYVSAEFDGDGLFTGNVAVGRGASVPSNTATMAYRRIFEVQDGEVLPSVQFSLEVANCAGVFSWGSV